MSCLRGARENLGTNLTFGWQVLSVFQVQPVILIETQLKSASACGSRMV